MTLKQIVIKLEEEIKGKKRKEAIEVLEEQLSENIEELSKNENFFNLPLNHIFSVISKVDFNEIEESDKIIEIIQNIIKNIISKHFEEKETILILQNLNITTISFSYEEIFSFLELITNCPILFNFCNLFKEQKQLPDVDFTYEIQQKDKEIEKLRQQISDGISNEFPPITEKPEDYEPNIFEACKKGKLTSVQLLIEKENEDKNKKVTKPDYEDYWENDTPIHIACRFGHLPIVQYLIEKQNVDKDIRGAYDWTPLHCACENGYLPIAEYLLSKGVNIEAKDINGNYLIHFASIGGLLSIVQYLIEKHNVDKDIKGYNIQTPLHYACWKGHLPIVEYLISKGANFEAKNSNEETPLHYASKLGRLDVVKYLISLGANKNAKNKDGKTPYDVVCRDIEADESHKDEIRNILKWKWKQNNITKNNHISNKIWNMCV